MFMMMMECLILITLLTDASFIPRSPGSQITTLGSAGRFDVAQLVLDDMRRNVRKAMFIDELDTRQAKTPLSAKKYLSV